MALFDTLVEILTPYADGINDLKSRVPVLEDDIVKIASDDISYLASNKGGYVKGDGTIATSASARYSDFIKIPDNAYSIKTYVKATGSNGSTLYIKPAIVFFDEEKNVIASVSNTSHTAYYDDNTGFINFPLYLDSVSGAKYIRINCSSKTEDQSLVSTQFVILRSERQNISRNSDLNEFLVDGTYLLYVGNTHTNMPSFYSSGPAWVIVKTNFTGAYLFQLFIEHTSGKMAYRAIRRSDGSYIYGDWIPLNDSPLRGKKISFIGDSISSYNGYNPSGYSYYYPKSGSDVTSVNATWWKKVIDKSGMTLVRNASWSGSGVADTDDDPTNTAYIAYSDARISDLSTEEDDPDIIVALIGTNDFHRNVPIGTLTETSEVPTGVTSIQTFKEAYACMINKIRTAYPHAHVYCCTLIQRYDSNDPITGYPILNDSGIALSQYNKAIKEISDWMGCVVIPLDKAISLSEIPDIMIDGTLHPNATGHTIIANKVLQVLSSNETVY